MMDKLKRSLLYSTLDLFYSPCAQIDERYIVTNSFPSRTNHLNYHVQTYKMLTVNSQEGGPINMSD